MDCAPVVFGMVFGLHPLGLLALASLSLHMAYFVLAGRPYARKIFILSGATTIATWLLFVSAFVYGDYSLWLVYSTSSEGLPLHFRIAASWSNSGGSILLMALGLAAARLLLARVYLSSPASSLLAVFFEAVALVLAFITGAFSETPFKAESGLGINPLLKSKWVLVHPVATFMSYSLILSALSVSMASKQLSLPMARAAWILLTGALLLGGVWSYQTLGWGGYWAWDPVEVSQLLVWVILTGYFHSRLVSEVLARCFLYWSSASVFLGIYVVRTGFSPIHSFAEENALVSLATLPLAVSLASLPVLVYWDRFGWDSRRLGWVKALYMIPVIASIYAALVIMGAFLPPIIGSLTGAWSTRPPAWDSGIRYYHTLLMPALGVVVIWLPGVYAYRYFGRPASIATVSLLAAALLASALYLISRGGPVLSPESGSLTNIAGPPIALTALIGALILGAASFKALRRRLVERSLASLAHSLLLLMVVGVILSGPYSYNSGYFTDLSLGLGEYSQAGGIGVELVSSEYRMQGGNVSFRSLLAGESQIMEAAFLLTIYSVYLMEETSRSLEEAKRNLEELGIAGYLGNEYELGGDLVAPVESVSPPNRVAWLEAGELVFVAREPRVRIVLAPYQSPDLSRLGAVIGVIIRAPQVLLEPGGVVDPAGGMQLANLTIRFKDEVSLDLGGLRLAITGVQLRGGGEWVAMASTGYIDTGRGAVLPFPLTIWEEGLYYYARYLEDYRFRGAVDIYQAGGLGGLAKAVRVEDMFLDPACSLVPLTELPAYPACLKPGKLGSQVPEGVELVLGVKVTAGGRTYYEEIGVRYDINGELLGIRGLVPKSYTIRLGLHDAYLAFYPPLVNLTPDIVMPETAVAYLGLALGGPGNVSVESVFLHSVIVSSYLYANYGPLTLSRIASNPYEYVYAVLKLYELSRPGLSGAPLGLSPPGAQAYEREFIVRVKLVPYVWLVWLSGAGMLALEALILIISLRPLRYGVNRRE